MDVLHNLPQLVTAVGGLGTAAFGLVDATKVFWGGVNHVGFRKIAKGVSSLAPNEQQTTNVISSKTVASDSEGKLVQRDRPQQSEVNRKIADQAAFEFVECRCNSESN
jgi:hypothetical protein